MWIEELDNGKFKFFERYTDPYTEKWRKVSVTLINNNSRSTKEASRLLQAKIKEKLKSYSTSDKTFKELTDEWLKYQEVRVKRKSYLHSLDELVLIDRFIKPEILIRNIDSKLVTKLVDKLYTFGNYSFNYTSQIKSTVSQILKFAIEKNYLEHNPADRVIVKPKKSEEELRRKNIEEKYLEKDEIVKILNYLYATSRRENNGRIAEFLWYSGLRFGELQALQWKEFNGSSIDVTGTLDSFKRKISESEKTSPKNFNSRRVVDLPERAIEILSEQKQINTLRFGHIQDDDYIFLSVQKNPVVLNTFNNQLKLAAKSAKISKNLTSHIFRHSHVSLLAEMNLPLKTIIERVGHGDAATKLKIYNHVTNKSRKDVIEALNKITMPEIKKRPDVN